MNLEVGSEHAEVCVPTTKQTNKLRQGFITLAETLLESIADVFPECDSTLAVLRIFRLVIKDNADLEDKFVWRCQALFKENTEGVRSHDPETLFLILEQLDHLRDINLREKWEDPDFTEDSKMNLWQYVTSLKTYADLYTAVPKNVMSKIETVAGSLGDQLVRGELDLKNMDIGALGQNLLSDLSPDELSNFESKLPEIYGSLSQVAGSLGGGNGAKLDLAALMKQLSEQENRENGAGGKVDMTEIIQKLATQLPPAATGTANGNVDIAQMMSTMGPLVAALTASQGDANTPQIANCAQNSRNKPKRKKTTK
uniref:Uncharacterized protein n=1 Tax=viral metagenome TaxID=1070528 RepID=A0A6C0BYT3_9ZZZZ